MALFGNSDPYNLVVCPFEQGQKKKGVGIGANQLLEIMNEHVDSYTVNIVNPTNSIENFKYGFKEIAIDKFISRMDQNQDIFTRMMNDQDFNGLVMDYLLKKVYGRLSL